MATELSVFCDLHRIRGTRRGPRMERHLCDNAVKDVKGVWAPDVGDSSIGAFCVDFSVTTSCL